MLCVAGPRYESCEALPREDAIWVTELSVYLLGDDFQHLIHQLLRLNTANQEHNNWQKKRITTLIDEKPEFD